MVNLNQLVYALSDTLDLVGVDDVNHGKRVAFMALQCAKELESFEIDTHKLLHAALLHDCGVSSTRIHDKLILTLEWDGAKDHCIRGYQLLNTSDKLKHLSNVVLYHHTHYEELLKMNIDEETLIMSNLIFLVDRVDALVAQYHIQKPDILMLTVASKVQKDIHQLSGTFFKAELVEAFLKASDREVFWFTLESNNLHIFYDHYLSLLEVENIDLPSLGEISKLFGYIVDAKSQYTANHSLDVAKLSRFIGEKMNLDPEICDKIEIAGLLHDLGKLRIPDELLYKRDKLTNDEFNILKLHAYTTNQILSNIEGMEDIAQWAGQHHERLNGKGYPYHTTEKDLPLPSRILSVADIFQALAQKRPYHDNLKPLDIMDILTDRVNMGELDNEVVLTVQNNLHKCWEISLANSN